MNLIGILIAWTLSLERPLFNGEYALLFLLATVSRRGSLIFTLALILMLCEWFIVINSNVFFLNWREMYELAVSDASPQKFLIKPGIALAAYVAAAAWIALGGIFRNPKIAGLLIAILVGSYAFENVQRAAFGRDQVEANYVFFPAATLAHKLVRTNSRQALVLRLTGKKTASVSPLTEPSRAHAVLEEAASGGLANHASLFLIESWGYESDAETRDLMGPVMLAQFGDRAIEIGSEVSFGSTINGELRVLCGKRLHGLNVPARDIRGSCLPDRFRSEGFLTRSFHGYLAPFYLRHTWYPEIGFSKSLWKSDVAGKICDYAVTGACDQSLIDAYVRERSDHPAEKSFSYVLTLDTHLPMTLEAKLDLLAAQKGTGSSHNSPIENDYDVYRAMLMRTLRHIGELAHQAPEELFVIVGDHAPYLLIHKLRKTNMAKDRVPYVIIYPAGYLAGKSSRSAVSPEPSAIDAP